jgi:amino acid transporter
MNLNGNKKALSPTGLARQLGLFDSTMVMVGIVIGSGIFLTTGVMAKSIPPAGLILLAWLFGGLLTLAGALPYAELGAALPEIFLSGNIYPAHVRDGQIFRVCKVQSRFP